MAMLKDSIITGDLRVTGTIYGDVPLDDLVDADDLKAIEALSGSGIPVRTGNNTWTINASVPPSAHAHGNLTSEGKVGADANKAIYTGTGGAIQAGTLPVAGGGTGQVTFTSGELLMGNGTNGLSTIVKTSANTANTVVLRDASGNFTAGTITAALSGNASTATKWADAQTVYVTLGTASTNTTIQGGSTSAQTIGVDGTLGVANGGTGATSFTANSAIISGSTTTGAFTTRAIKNNTSATAAANNSTDLITQNTLYYATASINNARQTSSVSIYAPTSAGTSGYILKSSGGTSAPVWLQTLPVSNGGTGKTSFTANSIIMSGSTTTAALTTRAVTNNTSNAAITNNNTNIPTMNTIYYGLVTVNNASQTRATGIYAPTSAGTANQVLKSAGGTSAPTWATPE